MTHRYSHLRFDFPKESRESAKNAGLTDFLKTEDGKRIIAEFHSIVKSSYGNTDETFLRAIDRALEEIQYKMLNYFTQDGLSREQRERYRKLCEFLPKLKSSEGSSPEPEEAAMIVMCSILQELKNTNYSLN